MHGRYYHLFDIAIDFAFLFYSRPLNCYRLCYPLYYRFSSLPSQFFSLHSSFALFTILFPFFISYLFPFSLLTSFSNYRMQLFSLNFSFLIAFSSAVAVVSQSILMLLLPIILSHSRSLLCIRFTYHYDYTSLPTLRIVSTREMLSYMTRPKMSGDHVKSI
jgi:hypothetical protein